MSYVYLYLDPQKPTDAVIEGVQLKYEPIYVGKGNGNRYLTHLNKAQNYILRNKINKIKHENLIPIIIKIKDNLSDGEAFLLETQIIEKFGRIDCNTGILCNMTDGGDGFSSADATRENLKRYANGYTMSKEAREIVRQTRIRTNKSKEHRKINSEKNSRSYELRYGDKKAKEMKTKRSEKIMGANNPAAKTYKIIKPTGEEIIIKSLKTFCNEQGLIWNTVRSNVNTGIIKRNGPKDTSFFQSETKRKIEGWEIIEITTGDIN